MKYSNLKDSETNIKKSLSVQFNKPYRYNTGNKKSNLKQNDHLRDELRIKNPVGESILNSFRVKVEDPSEEIFKNSYLTPYSHRENNEKESLKMNKMGKFNNFVKIGDPFRGSFGKTPIEFKLNNHQSINNPNELNISDKVVINSFNFSSKLTDPFALSLQKSNSQINMYSQLSSPYDTKTRGQDKVQFLSKQNLIMPRAKSKTLETNNLKKSFPKISFLKKFMKNDIPLVENNSNLTNGQNTIFSNPNNTISFKTIDQRQTLESELLKKSMSQPSKVNLNDKHRISNNERDPNYSKFSQKINYSYDRQYRFNFDNKQININELKEIFEKEIPTFAEKNQKSSVYFEKLDSELKNEKKLSVKSNSLEEEKEKLEIVIESNQINPNIKIENRATIKTNAPMIPPIQPNKNEINLPESQFSDNITSLKESTKTLPYLSLQSPSLVETQKILLSFFSIMINYTPKIEARINQLSMNFNADGFFYGFAENTPDGKALSLFGLSNFFRFLRIDFSFITIYRIMNHLSEYTLADFSQVISVSTQPRNDSIRPSSYDDNFSISNKKIYIELPEFEKLFNIRKIDKRRRRRKTMGDWRALALTQSSDYSTIKDIVLLYGKKLEKMAKTIAELKRVEANKIFDCFDNFKLHATEGISENLLSEKNLDEVEAEMEKSKYLLSNI